MGSGPGDVGTELEEQELGISGSVGGARVEGRYWESVSCLLFSFFDSSWERTDQTYEQPSHLWRSHVAGIKTSIFGLIRR